MPTAVVAGSYWRGGRYQFPVVRSSGPGGGGVPFLQNSPEFAAQWPSARLYVEWAPSAPLPTYVDDSSAWPWEDITTDVMYSSGISISPMGRSDATSQTQPAGCAFTIDNRSGRYSRGPQNSAYYPNVKLNVPIRVCISLDGTPQGKVVRFQGYAWSFKPSWDTTGAYAVVAVSASGYSRRLQQRSTPLKSPLYRLATFDSRVVAYWPMEDGATSTQFSSGLQGKSPMRFTNMEPATYSGIPGSQPLPTLTATSTYSGTFSADFSAGSTFVFYMNVPAAPSGSTAIMRIHMAGATGGIGRWEIVLSSGSTTNMTVNGYDASSTLVVNNTHGGFSYAGSGPVQILFGLHQNGGNAEYNLTRGGITFSGSAAGTGSTSGTIGNPIRIDMLANAANDGIGLGHVMVYNRYLTTVNPLPAQAWVGDGGDSAVSRILGLSQEENVPVQLNGSAYTQFDPTFFPVFGNGNYTWVGYQTEDDYLALIRSAAGADLGFLGDGLGPGVFFRNRNDITNQASRMTLDATADEIMPPFQPEDDDQQIANKVTATRVSGSASTVEDSTGPLGTGTVDVYEDAVTVNVRYDDQTDDIGGWLVHLGTVEGYRYPTLSLDMRKIPNHAAEWLSMRPADLFTVTNVSAYASQHPAGAIALLAQGWSEKLTSQQWDVTVNCSPADAWRVIELGDVAIATDTQFTQRLDSTESTLSAAAAAGDTSITVATASTSPLWTTSSGDLPFDIYVGGWRVTCSAITGASSPQTFTITALPSGVAAGQTVKLWYPPTLGI